MKLHCLKIQLFFWCVLISSNSFSANIDPAPETRFKFINDEIVFYNLPKTQEGEYIKYGYTILSKTAELMGPDSQWDVKSRNTKSRMSCRNCHIAVGTQEFGNSFLDTHKLYPQYRAREGKIQTLAQRINACFTHPMQGKPIDENSKEMHAIEMYILWIGKNRKPLDADPDTRISKIEFVNRAADPVKGKVVFENNCVRCHGNEGQGQLSDNKKSFKYPPLWGKQSFVIGSSMSRISILARFIYGNMPYMSDKKLTTEEAWDVAAFIESNARPVWNGKDAPFKNISEKAFDFPVAPFADSFSANQHKYGPFKPIIDYWKQKSGETALGPSGI
jgi:thiosulfate dehydrogenase